MLPSTFPIAALTVSLACCGAPAVAQQSPAAPDKVIAGSRDVTIEGRPAARSGDPTTSGAPVVEGSPNVFIDGRPAAVVGGRTGCGGAVGGGSANVFINGKPAAQTGSTTAGCPGR